MSVTRARRQRGRVSTALMDIMVSVRMPGDLNLAPAALAPRYGRLRVLHVPPFSEGHAPNGHRPVRRLWLLNINLTMIGHSFVLVHIRSPILRLLQLPAQPFFSLGHRSDRRKLLQQGVSTERSLDRQRGVPRLHAAVLSLQHLDLFIQEVL